MHSYRFTFFLLLQVLQTNILRNIKTHTLGFRRLSSDDDAHCINTYASIHFSSSFIHVIIFPETNSFPLLVKQNKTYTSAVKFTREKISFLQIPLNLYSTQIHRDTVPNRYLLFTVVVVVVEVVFLSFSPAKTISNTAPS